MKKPVHVRQRCTASKRSLILLAALVFSGAYAEAQQKPKVKHLFPSGTEVVIGKKTLPDPLHPYESMVDLKLAAQSAIQKSSGCDKLEVWQTVIVQPEQWRSVDPSIPTGYSEVGVLAVQDTTNCVKVGHPMRVGYLRPPAGIGTELGWFYPTSIVGRRAEMAQQEARLLFKAKLPADTQDVVFVTGRVIQGLPQTFLPRAPRMVGARFIDREQLETAIREGTQIVDVRSKAAYTQFRVKGSVNIPYTTGPRMNLYEEYSQYVAAGDAFDVRRVNPDKSKPVVIIGSFSEPSIYRAAVVLRSEGWKNVLVFWEGIEYFSGMAWSPPAQSNLVRIVDGYELARMVKDPVLKTVVLDVRAGQHFSRGAIPGAYTSEFFERDDLRLRVPGLNGAMLVDYSEWVKVPPGVTPASPVIVVGYGGRDWSGYKAALILQHYGFGNVSWYRGGMGEWSNLVDLNRQIFGRDSHPWPFPKGYVGGPKK